MEDQEWEDRQEMILWLKNYLRSGERISTIDAIELLDSLAWEYDTQETHELADQVLVAVLRNAGLGEVADAFNRAQDRCEFWYA